MASAFPSSTFLWLQTNKRNKTKSKVAADEADFQVNIPDTIIYNFQKPQFWYFTSRAADSKERGTIRRKKRLNLSASRIIEHMVPAKSPSGIAAVLVQPKAPRPDPDVRANTSITAGDADDASTVTPRKDAGPDTAAVVPARHTALSGVATCYLDNEGLRSIVERSAVSHGIIQQMVDPWPCHDGVVRNSVITAYWQPRHIFFERKQNKNSLYPKPGQKLTHEELQERGQTAEGTFSNTSLSALVSGVTLGRLTEICNSIADHIRVVSDYTVRKMVLNFAVDARRKIWLLYCSSISVINWRPLAVRTIASNYASLKEHHRAGHEHFDGAISTRKAELLAALSSPDGSRVVRRKRVAGQNPPLSLADPCPRGVDPLIASSCNRTTLKLLQDRALNYEATICIPGADTDSSKRRSKSPAIPEYSDFEEQAPPTLSRRFSISSLKSSHHSDTEYDTVDATHRPVSSPAALSPASPSRQQVRVLLVFSSLRCGLAFCLVLYEYLGSTLQQEQPPPSDSFNPVTFGHSTSMVKRVLMM